MQKRASITKTVEGSSEDYTLVSDMAVYYSCQLSKESGKDLLGDATITESLNLKSYFHDKNRKVFLTKYFNEVAGFALVNQAGVFEDTKWNIGEFFVLTRFQKRGIGREMAFHIWDSNPGKWEVAVRPDNQKAINFWRSIVSEYTQGVFQESIESVSFDSELPQRVIFAFERASI